MPTVGELYLKYISSYGLVFQGNPELRPETLWAFELGARRRMLRDRLRVEAVAFLNEGFDTIDFVYSTPVSATNLDRSRVVGAELSVQGEITHWLQLRASCSYQDARDVRSNAPLLYRPAWKGSLGALTRRWDFELGITARFTGARRYDDFLDSAAATIDPDTGRLRFPRRNLDPATTVDLDLRWIGPQGLTAALHLRNLLDSQALIIQGYPSPGREWMLEAFLPW
jgi:outer membrane cobalamin receptor